jgi:hypothetical protein
MEFEEDNDDATTVVEGEEEFSEFSEPSKSSLETATLSDAYLIQELQKENAHLKYYKEFLEQHLEEMLRKFGSERIQHFNSPQSSPQYHGQLTSLALPLPVSLSPDSDQEEICVGQPESGISHHSELVEGHTSLLQVEGQHMEFEEDNDDATTVVEGEEEFSEFSEPSKSSLETATLSDAYLIQELQKENAHLKYYKEFLEQHLEEMLRKFGSERIQHFNSPQSSPQYHGQLTSLALPLPVSLSPDSDQEEICVGQPESGISHHSELVEGHTSLLQVCPSCYCVLQLLQCMHICLHSVISNDVISETSLIRTSDVQFPHLLYWLLLEQ